MGGHSDRSTAMPGLARMFSWDVESTTFLFAASQQEFLNHTSPSWRTTIPTCETSRPSGGGLTRLLNRLYLRRFRCGNYPRSPHEVSDSPCMPSISVVLQHRTADIMVRQQPEKNRVHMTVCQPPSGVNFL